MEEADNSGVKVTGFSSIEEASESFLQTLTARDYNSYLTHVITPDIERKLAKQIGDRSKRKEFVREFGFSMRNERESFDDILKYLDEKGLDPASAAHDELEIIDYESAHYAPLEMKEVIIPFPYENYEIDLIITVVKYEGSWLLTSEISL